MAVWVAGLAAAGASVLLAIITGLALLQLAMASSAKRMVVSYSTAIIGKVALATLASKYVTDFFSQQYIVKFFLKIIPKYFDKIYLDLNKYTEKKLKVQHSCIIMCISIKFTIMK